MKDKLSYILIFILFIFHSHMLIPAAHAQGWKWGRAGIGANVESWSVAADPFGNAYGSGFREDNVGTIDFGGGVKLSPSYSAAFWVKYDANGNALWADGTQNGYAYIHSTTTDASGSLILFGASDAPSLKIGSFTLTNLTGNPQYFIAKVSPTGTVLWAINDGNIIPTLISFLIAAVPDGAGAVTTDAAGNIYVTSSFIQPSMTIGSTTFTNADPSGSTYDVFVAKYTPAGTLVWANTIGGSKNDYGLGIAVSTTGNVYICGAFSSPSVIVGPGTINDPNFNPRAFIAKFSPAGAPLWAEAGGGTHGAYAIGLTSDNSGNVYMAGSFDDVSITFGAVTINRTFPAASPQPAVYLAQFSSADVVTWSKSIGSKTAGIWAYSISQASCGQVWVGGSYDQDAVVAPGDTLKLVDSAADPVFLAGYDLSGGVKGYGGINSGGDDASGISCDPSGNVFLCGDFAPATRLFVGPDTLRDTVFRETFYVAKYSNSIFASDTIINDTSLCAGSTGVTLSGPAGYLSYLWNDGSTGPTRTVTAAGKYYVLSRGSCGTAVIIDTFTVNKIDTNYYQRDTSLCTSTGTVTLNAPPGYDTYLWSTGSSATSVTEGSGTYWVCATRGCVSTFDSFRVTISLPPVVNLGNDTTLCPGQTFTLTSLQPSGYTFLWNTGSIADSVKITQSGTYSLTVFNGPCQSTDSMTVSELPPPPSIALGPDTTLCHGDTIRLNVDAGSNSLLWSTGSKDQSITVTETGLYKATVYNACGSSSDSVQITFDPCDIWFPSAFTPNNDGRNDIARVVGNLKFFTDFSLSIYNRFGQRVFYTKDIYAGWDGTFNSVPQDLDTYFYMIFYTLEGHKHMLKGDLTLIR